MRNALIISSILLLAVACKRDDNRTSGDMGQGTTPSETTGPGGTTPGGGTMDRSGDMPSDQPGGATGTQPSDTGTMQPGAGTQQPPSGTGGAGTQGMQGQQGTQPSGASGTTGMQGGQDAGSMQGQQGGMAGTKGGMAGVTAISCDKIVSTNVRDKYLSKGKVTEVPTSVSSVAMCRIEGPGLKQAAAIQAACDQTPSMTAEQMQQANPDGKMVANVGKAAVLVETGDTKQLTAVDDDSNCQINVTVPRDVDAVAISREVLKSLPGEG